MKSTGLKLAILALVLTGIAAAFGWRLLQAPGEANPGKTQNRKMLGAPVEVAPVEHGPIALRRTFSGTLEARAEFVVAPKVSGRVERILVDIADTVRRGQVVAELDNAEYVQAVAQARAGLAVAQANLAQARSNLEIANREFERTASLRQRGISSDSEFDAAKADLLAKQARLQVTKAQVTQAMSTLEVENIRLGYTQVTAGWTGDDEVRVVAERYLDEGQTVAANAPLLLIVKLQPIDGVLFVTEKDYARLAPEQLVSLTTDAYPGERFQGRIERIAPIFSKSTRQARIELVIENSDDRLKPGMFIRTTVVLEQLPEATIVPEAAITKRDEQTGVFVVSGDGRSVAWREVMVGIREGDRVQVTGTALAGRVVTLGQQLLSDGAAITIPGAPEAEDAEGDGGGRS
jgi:RND family efflux transporter MFP subunit